VTIGQKIYEQFGTHYFGDSETSTEELFDDISNHPLNDEAFKTHMSESLFSFITDKSLSELQPENQKYIRSLQL
jgi:hypothetical protein